MIDEPMCEISSLEPLPTNNLSFSFVVSLCAQIVSISCDMIWSTTIHILSCICHCVRWCKIGLISLSPLSNMITIRITIEANIKLMIAFESYMTNSTTKLTDRSISTMTTSISSTTTTSTFASLVTLSMSMVVLLSSIIANSFEAGSVDLSIMSFNYRGTSQLLKNHFLCLKHVLHFLKSNSILSRCQINNHRLIFLTKAT